MCSWSVQLITIYLAKANFSLERRKHPKAAVCPWISVSIFFLSNVALETKGLDYVQARGQVRRPKEHGRALSGVFVTPCAGVNLCTPATVCVWVMPQLVGCFSHEATSEPEKMNNQRCYLGLMLSDRFSSSWKLWILSSQLGIYRISALQMKKTIIISTALLQHLLSINENQLDSRNELTKNYN